MAKNDKPRPAPQRVVRKAGKNPAPKNPLKQTLPKVPPAPSRNP